MKIEMVVEGKDRMMKKLHASLISCNADKIPCSHHHYRQSSFLI